MENSEKILEIFEKENCPLRSGDLIEKTGIEKKEVDKILKNLKEEDKIYSPKRCFYEIKK